MTEKPNTGRTQIILAMISLVGAISASLFANWDKVFPPALPYETNAEIVPANNSPTQTDVNTEAAPQDAEQPQEDNQQQTVEASNNSKQEDTQQTNP